MSWMQTISGRKFWPQDIANSEFHVPDIAHALSMLNRFGGHTKFPYSVAQHSVLVSEIVAELGGSLDQVIVGLMHDATEAYLVDIPTPVKHLLKGYKELEQSVWEGLIKQLKLPSDGGLPEIVKEADGIALVTEASQLIHGDIREWPAFKKHGIWPTRIMELPHQRAALEFLARWNQLQDRLSK